MAETIVSFVSDHLSILLREEGKLLGGLRLEVQLIKDELRHMKAFLKVAELNEDDDPGLREWIKQVQEAAYDIEDVLDEFVFRFAGQQSHGFKGCLRRIFNTTKNLQARHRLASEIQSIKIRIRNISEAHKRYQSEYGGISDQVSRSLSMTNSWRYSRDDALLVEEAKLVGIEKPKQHLISQLLDGDSQFKVISVVGMGGLGKTTLVKKIYEDPNVRRHFPFRAWVTVSQTCDFQELLKNLIQQLHEEIKKPVPPFIESMTIAMLKESIKDFLKHAGRYAIVFDDVWDMEFWNEIKFALPENSCGNRVMLTTRIADIASASCTDTQGFVYKMKPLSFDESWTLFCNKIFKDSSCPDHLRDVATAILSKCEGLPLAIIAISGLLALKDVSRMDEWEIVRRSLGGELEGTGNLEKVHKILRLSFNNLPSHLKTCLLYISIFPEDYEIPCFQLIHLWIAERFVEWRGGMSIEDLAWGYLRELVNRSLVQVTEVFYEGIPISCRIHDLLREVIVSKSREQNMVTIATGQHIRWPPEKVRRLVIHGSSNFLPPHNNRNNTYYRQESQYYCFDHLRSLITFGSMEPHLSKTLISEVLSCTNRLLKVLDLSNAQMLEEILNDIFNLFHYLRYLNLYGTRVKTVPKSIGKLQNLEYLDLGETEVRELPLEILKLQKLRHLFVFQQVDAYDLNYGYYGFKAPSKIGGLLTLHSLYYIDVAAAEENEVTNSIVLLEEIGKLSQLRDLGITNLRRKDGKQLCSSLEKLTNLRVLEVFSTGKDDEAIDLNHHRSLSSYSPSSFLQSLRRLVLTGRLEKMPEWITCLQGLVKIELRWSRLRIEEDPFEALQHLPNLVDMYLKQTYQGEGLCFKAEGFLKLKRLYLRKLEELRWMIVEEGAMPCLQKLMLHQLPLLEELPLGIQHLTQLQELDLADVSSQLVEKLESQNKESEDYKRNIAHVPEITIGVWTDGEWRRRQL